MSQMVPHGSCPPLSWPALSWSQGRAPPVSTAVLRASSPFCSALLSSTGPAPTGIPMAGWLLSILPPVSLHRWERRDPKEAMSPSGRATLARGQATGRVGAACVSWRSPPAVSSQGDWGEVPLGTQEWSVPCFLNIQEAAASRSSWKEPACWGHTRLGCTEAGPPPTHPPLALQGGSPPQEVHFGKSTRN